MNAQQQRELEHGLRALADSTRTMHASGGVEHAVLAKMGSADAMVSATSGLSPRSAPGLEGAKAGRLLPLAAALILAVGGALWTVRNVQAPDVVHPAGFMALPGAAWLPEMESATIVRVSLPVTALPAYGVPIQPDVKSDAVLAELLVAQDGQPRAIRFVNESD